MKTSVYLITGIIAIIVIGCIGTKEKSADELLKNPTMEEDIYTSIIKDTAHLSKFMNKMMANESCKSMVEKNNSLVKMVCMSEKIDSLVSNDKQIREKVTGNLFKKMEADSVVCDETCIRLSKNQYLNNYFKQHVSAYSNEDKGLKSKIKK